MQDVTQLKSDIQDIKTKLARIEDYLNSLEVSSPMPTASKAVDGSAAKRIPTQEVRKASIQNTSQPKAPVTDTQNKNDTEYMTKGYFDGTDMVAEDGNKYPVPTIYYIKNKLVYGDTLNYTKKEGSRLFSIAKKGSSKAVTGILENRDRDWFVLTPEAAYKVSFDAVKYFKAQPHDEVSVLVPADNQTCDVATIEKVIFAEPAANPNTGKPQARPAVKSSSVRPPQSSGTTVSNIKKSEDPAFNNSSLRQASNVPAVPVPDSSLNVPDVSATQTSSAPDKPTTNRSLGDYSPRVITDDDLR